MSRIERYLINRDYARLWSGQAVSTIGDYVFDTTVVLWVATVVAKGKPWAPVAVSGVLLAVGGAVFLVGPLAGVFVDRWNRKRTMLASELLRAALVAVLMAVAFLPHHTMPVAFWLTLIYVIVFLLNAVGQFFSPARFATMGLIVTGDADRARAAGIGQATTAVAAIVGPPLAAPLLFTVGVQWAMLINALSYVFSYFAVRAVRVPAAEPAAVSSTEDAGSALTSLRSEFVAGLRFFGGNRLLVTILTMAIITQCGTGALNTLNVFFATGNLHIGASRFGLLSMSFGAGAIVGSLVAGRIVARFGARTVTWSCLVLGGVLVFLYSRQTVFVAGMALLFLFALPVGTLNTAMTPLLLRATPQEYLGRVVAVFNPLNELASMLSVVVAGWLASTALSGYSGRIAGIHFTSIDTIFAASGLLIIIAGVYGSIALPREASEPKAESVMDGAMEAEPTA